MKMKVLILSLTFTVGFSAPNESRDINLLTDGSRESVEYYGEDEWLAVANGHMP